MLDVKDRLKPRTQVAKIFQFLALDRKLFRQFRTQINLAQRNERRTLWQLLGDQLVFDPPDQIFIVIVVQFCFRNIALDPPTSARGLQNTLVSTVPQPHILLLALNRS